MLTLKQILVQICPEDWFLSVDLKDANFHIQIASRHRPFLRFAFEGVAYQYTVLPFGLSLAPHTFRKCVDAALSPLRQMGIRILNYLDDWLVLADSERQLIACCGSLEIFSPVSVRRAVGNDLLVTTDASGSGWDTLYEGNPAYGTWSTHEQCLNINCLEMMAVCLALKNFLPALKGHHVGQHDSGGLYQPPRRPQVMSPSQDDSTSPALGENSFHYERFMCRAD